MKQQVFIIAGAVTVLLLILVWAYLMFFGTPKTVSDVFSEFGVSGEVDTSYVPPVDVLVPKEEDVNMERARLKQISTHEVAGYVEVSSGTSTEAETILEYVESGTGHIYTVNINTGEEKRISGTTIAQAKEAHFSPDGKYVAISKNSNSKGSPLVVGQLSTSSELILNNFSEEVHDFSIKNNNELLYTKYGNQNLEGYSYNLKSGVTKNIFTIPFYDAVIVWGNNAASTHYVYPRAAHDLEGYLYQIKGGLFTRLPIEGFGLTANANEDMVIYTKTGKNSSEGYIYDKEEKESRPLQSAVIPEKCYVPPTGLELLCAQEPKIATRDFIDTWHKGTTEFKDSLWLLSAETMTGELMVDTFAESGRELDIINVGVGSSKKAAYFINKNDNSLWMYEL